MYSHMLDDGIVPKSQTLQSGAFSGTSTKYKPALSSTQQGANSQISKTARVKEAVADTNCFRKVPIDTKRTGTEYSLRTEESGEGSLMPLKQRAARPGPAGRREAALGGPGEALSLDLAHL